MVGLGFDRQGRRLMSPPFLPNEPLFEAVKLVSQNGALSIRLAATHGIFSGEARERLSSLPVDEILITNTLPQTRFRKIRILDISPLIVDALVRT